MFLMKRRHETASVNRLFMRWTWFLWSPTVFFSVLAVLRNAVNNTHNGYIYICMYVLGRAVA